MKKFDIKAAIGIVLLFVIIGLMWGIAGNFIFDKNSGITRQKPIAFNRIYTNLLVEDVTESIDFYKDFGFNSTTVYPDSGKYQFAIIKRDSVELMLQSKESFDTELDLFTNKNIGGTISLYFDVDNIDSVYTGLNDTVRVIEEMNETFYGTKEFAILDNNGYLLIFAEEL